MKPQRTIFAESSFPCSSECRSPLIADPSYHRAAIKCLATIIGRAIPVSS
jgi:hypothetical protein